MGPEVTATPTRDRILFAAAELFRRQGYSATGINEVVAAADARLGSLYHFFPGGKQQLAAEVIETAGPFFEALVISRVGPEVRDAGEWVARFFAGAAEFVSSTGYADACPISTMAMEFASTNDGLRERSADTFELWVSGIERELSDRGVPPERRRSLAELLLAALEGGFVLSRTRRDTEALHAAAEHIAPLVAAEADSG